MHKIIKDQLTIHDFGSPISPNEFVKYYKDNLSLIDESLLTEGAILFRNCSINEVSDFNFILDNITSELKSYIDGNSPRTKMQSKIYTSTEYDEDYTITQHNELSYSINYPKKIFFCCLVPANFGGETPIVDCREVLKSMDPMILDLFREKGIKYIRNLHGGKGMGKSWQETFETDNMNEVEIICQNSDIEYEWRSNGILRLIQNRPATIKHPITNEEVWFNQIDQFHPTQFPDEIYETLSMYYQDKFDMPIYGCFGDGSMIDDNILHDIRKLIDGKRIINKWNKGDLLVLDNILMSHGRMPFKGDRKVIVAME